MRMGTAIAPTQASYDADGVFSGSCIEWNSKAYAFYTGVSPEVQCAAVGLDEDLKSFSKLSSNPLIKSPPDVIKESAGFRDPSVWYEESEGAMRMIVGSGETGGDGRVLLYQTRNISRTKRPDAQSLGDDTLDTLDTLDSWEFKGILFPDEDSLKGNGIGIGDMYECPDMFPLPLDSYGSCGSHDADTDDAHMQRNGDEVHVMMISTLPQLPTLRTWYFLGNFDAEKGVFHPSISNQIPMDFGNIYAAKTFYDPLKDRRVLWGWVIETRSQKAFAAAGWAGSMSLPRVLTFEKGYMLIKPAEELKQLRNESIVKKGFSVPGNGSLVFLRESIQAELRYVFDPHELDKNSTVGCRVLSGSKEWTSVFYDADKKSIVIDRNHSSSSSEDVHSAIEIPVWSRKTGDPSVDDFVDVLLFIDHSIIEVFVNARAVGTARVYPTESDSVSVSMWADLHSTSQDASSFQFELIEMHTLDAIWS
eukprot:TRINITY_DN42106_c0_g1_i3.p1 TRINITY_DN42106_c0_g1~~TRINITY_DN42106_c0_g1_i3.p1  ORF type:complete len:476 (+),score=136.28 TRINITY_DN42106_c0_g1_i3:504-1931(+)